MEALRALFFALDLAGLRAGAFLADFFPRDLLAPALTDFLDFALAGFAFGADLRALLLAPPDFGRALFKLLAFTLALEPALLVRAGLRAAGLALGGLTGLADRVAAAFPAIAPRTPPTTAPTGPATLPMIAPVAAPAACFEIGGMEMFSDDCGV